MTPERNKSMLVSICTFKRTRRAELEYGVALGPDESNIVNIIDWEGNRVGLIHSYDLRPLMGCFDAVLPLNQPSLKRGEQASES